MQFIAMRKAGRTVTSRMEGRFFQYHSQPSLRTGTSRNGRSPKQRNERNGRVLAIWLYNIFINW